MLAAHLQRGGLCVAASHQPLALAGARLRSLALDRRPRHDGPRRTRRVRRRLGAAAAFAWALARDVRVALRSKAELGVQLLFYVIVVSLFPLAASPSREVLGTLGPGVLWTAALLASLLSLPRLFASDYADGTLEQIALSPRPLPALVSGKIAAHWLTTGLPVACSRRCSARSTRSTARCC